MADFTIYCDDLQEGIWFQELDPHFENAELEVIPSKKAEIMSCGLDEVLKYDRPDIILKRVDLPMPLFPMMAHFSPEDMEKLIFWNRMSLSGCA